MVIEINDNNNNKNNNPTQHRNHTGLVPILLQRGMNLMTSKQE